MWSLLKDTVTEWLEDRAQTEGAALAYFTVFSLAPLLVIVITSAGLIYGPEAIQGKLVSSIERFVGAGPAHSIEELIRATYASGHAGFATIISAIGTLIGASAAFVQLQDSLNLIMDVSPRPDRGWAGTVKDRFFSFLMVLFAGLLLLALLIASVAVAAAGSFFAGRIPGSETLWHLATTGFSFVLFALIFALVFKYVPDVKSSWRDVLLGGAITSVLYVVGKFLIGLYIGKSGVMSAYGAAGSLALLLLWVYYSAQILFFGAEFVKVYARCCGRDIVPAENAIPREEAEQLREASEGRATAQRPSARPPASTPSGRQTRPTTPSS